VLFRSHRFRRFTHAVARFDSLLDQPLADRRQQGHFSIDLRRQQDGDGVSTRPELIRELPQGVAVGGIHTPADDLRPGDLFRFGASSLLNDLLMQLGKMRTGRYMSGDDFSDA